MCCAGSYGRGHRRVRGGTVAELLWPAQLTQNANSQVFPLVAGRMLKACKAVREVTTGQYESDPQTSCVAYDTPINMNNGKSSNGIDVHPAVSPPG